MVDTPKNVPEEPKDSRPLADRIKYPVDSEQREQIWAKIHEEYQTACQTARTANKKEPDTSDFIDKYYLQVGGSREFRLPRDTLDRVLRGPYSTSKAGAATAGGTTHTLPQGSNPTRRGRS
jgi:hypothetical protein